MEIDRKCSGMRSRGLWVDKQAVQDIKETVLSGELTTEEVTAVIECLDVMQYGGNE